MQMAKRSNTSQELDDAIEASMANPDQPPPAVSPRLAALLRIAGDLRDLPSREFRERLKAELLAGGRESTTAVASHYGKPLMTIADYLARVPRLRPRHRAARASRTRVAIPDVAQSMHARRVLLLR